MIESHHIPDETDLTVAQLQVLELIREDPEATQQEFAEQLDLTPAAVSQRVQTIPHLHWKNRREFVEAFFNDGVEEKTEEDDPDRKTMNERDENEPPSAEATHEPIAERMEQIEDRLDQLSERVEQIAREVSEREHEPVTDSGLVRKLVLTLTRSELFSEEEEDRLLDRLLT